MARAPDPKKHEAKALYKQGLKLIEIANKLNVPDGTIRRWKSEQRWDDDSERSEKNIERSENKKKERKELIKKDIETVSKNDELTEKQKLFCIYNVRYFNATKSYQKAYGCSYETAMVEGCRLLRIPKIIEQINALKQNKLNKELLSEEDIFQKYIDIAFADITDFIEFGREEVPVMTMYGPLEEKDETTGEKKKVTKIINTVRFKESINIDGSLISEVKQGKDGASIKLADRMKAMEWLSNHMDMATAEQRARIKVYEKQAKDGVIPTGQTGVVLIPPVMADPEGGDVVEQ